MLTLGKGGITHSFSSDYSASSERLSFSMQTCHLPTPPPLLLTLEILKASHCFYNKGPSPKGSTHIVWSAPASSLCAVLAALNTIQAAAAVLYLFSQINHNFCCDGAENMTA